MIVLYLAIVGSLQLVTIWLIIRLGVNVMDFQKRFLKVSDLNLESLKNIATSMGNQRDAINRLGDASKSVAKAILQYINQTEGD